MYKVEALRHEEPDESGLIWDQDSSDGVAWRVVNELGIVMAIYDNPTSAHDARNNLNIPPRKRATLKDVAPCHYVDRPKPEVDNLPNPINIDHLKKQGIDTRLLEVALLNESLKQGYNDYEQTEFTDGNGYGYGHPSLCDK